MTETNVGIWLVAGLAILGLLVVVPAVSAHGNWAVLDNGTVPHGAYQDTVDERTAWMAEHMAAHGGVNATEWTNERANATSVATFYGVADGHRPEHDVDRGYHNDAGHDGDGHNQHETYHDNVEDSHDEHRNDDGEDTHDEHRNDDGEDTHDEHRNDHRERSHSEMYGGGHGC